MLKDLRNEKTNMVENDTNKEVDKVENKSTDKISQINVVHHCIYWLKALLFLSATEG